jgi:hypothetical protein
MIEYVIVSERVGKPGTRFDPPDGVNVAALVENGFIIKKSDKKAEATSGD